MHALLMRLKSRDKQINKEIRGMFFQREVDSKVPPSALGVQGGGRYISSEVSACRQPPDGSKLMTHHGAAQQEVIKTINGFSCVSDADNLFLISCS